MHWLFIGGLLQIACASASALTYAALGDSYAAGDGAGSSRLLPNFDLVCARFGDAYPVQLAQGLKVGFDRFRNIACGGALTTTVLATQVPQIAGSDIVTIQVGGNEVDFFVILNECVQQWRPFSSCETELIRAHRVVQSTAFIDRYDAMIAGAKRTMQPGAKLFVLGYARFFNEYSEQCNHVTFSRTDPTNFLTVSLRRKLNDILVSLNQVIQGVAEGHGAIYVDVDRAFHGHRFCEDGVMEPAPDASWFFSDIGRQSVPTAEDRDMLAGQTIFPNPFKRFLNFTMTFHPTSDGHRGIANEVLRMIDDSERT